MWFDTVLSVLYGSVMEYRDHPGINHSTLKAFAKGAGYVKHLIDSGSKETEAMRLGTLTHLMVLEPHLMAEGVAIAPEINRRTKAGKEKGVKFQEDSAGKLVVTKEQALLAEAMADAVKAHPAASGLLNEFEFEAERECFWVDEFYGMQCKAKLDGVRPDGLILDLKTTMDASVAGFNRAIFNHYYFTQAAWYMQGLARSGGPEPTGFVFIAVQNQAPHEVCVVRMTPEAITIGARTVMDWLFEYRQRTKTNDWTSNPDVVDVTVPGWVDRKEG